MENKKTIKYISFMLKQEIYLRRLNKILMKPVIESDKVMFYVDNHYLNKLSNKTDEYNLNFYTLNKEEINYEKQKKLFDYYDLNKPFYYIIDGMIFDKKINLSVNPESTVVFRNCTFKEGIEINNSDKLILSNNKYFCKGAYSPINEKHYLTGKNINELTIINEDFSNKDYSHHPTPNFGIKLETNKINIINSNINADNTTIIEGKKYHLDTKGEIIIKSKELIISNSIIKSPNIYIKSSSIKNDKTSAIEATQCLLIENKNNDMKLNNIKSSYLIYNNQEEGLISINKVSETFKNIIYKTKHINKKILKKIIKIQSNLIE